MSPATTRRRSCSRYRVRDQKEALHCACVQRLKTSNCVKILYVQYANPGVYPPLEHSSRILGDNGWQVLVLGIGSSGTEVLRFPPHPRIQVRLLRYCPPGLRQKLHFCLFALWVLFTSARWRPQWVYASDSLSCPVAWAISFFSRGQLIYHEHDSPTPAVNGQSSMVSRFMRFALWTRRQVAQRAAFCVVPNARRGEIFKLSTKTQRPVLSVWNCPERSEATTIGTAPQSEGEFILFYHGSIVPARVPLAVLTAISMLPDKVRFQIAGYETIGHPRYVAILKAEAERLGVAQQFEYLGAFPRENLLPLCRRATVGLSLISEATSDHNEQTMIGASNKPFEYLACGIPLLVSDLPEWKETFVASGYALACCSSDAESIARSLRWFMEHPEETRKMGERGRQRILTDWNYETQFQRVQEKMMGTIQSQT
jgi:glycosyltransferase involved in cell wall biosynthesis